MLSKDNSKNNKIIYSRIGFFYSCTSENIYRHRHNLVLRPSTRALARRGVNLAGEGAVVNGKRSDEWKRQVGGRLRAVRAASGFATARDFAKELGVEENTLTSWERGLRLIEPEDLDGVRRLTGVTSDYIYYGDSAGLSAALIERLK